MKTGKNRCDRTDARTCLEGHRSRKTEERAVTEHKKGQVKRDGRRAGVVRQREGQL